MYILSEETQRSEGLPERGGREGTITYRQYSSPVSRDSEMVKGLRYKPEGRGFDT
jgi:hypothetical protein